MRSGTAVPSPAKLHPTLHMITERLARELVNPGERAPDWSHDEWTVAHAVAAIHGISPLLATSLPWRGPNTWTTFLHQQRAHTRARHDRIEQLLSSVDERSRAAGVAVTALKGAALHRLGVYRAGERPMADIDLLVRPADVQRTAEALTSLGFEQSAQTWKERVFTPVGECIAADLGENATNSLKIELHDRICERLPWHLRDVSATIFPTEPVAGLNVYPSKASLMRHLLLHAAGSMACQCLRLLQLPDIALLSERMNEADWQEMTTDDLAGDRIWWAYPPLELTARYYPGKIPASVLAILEGECGFVLRALASTKTLSKVSYSYLWVRAFPGIEWSQSIGELLGFAVSRLRPSASHLAHRKQIAANQTWAKRADWSRLSQGRRMLRWLTSRQARPVTMHAITAAFEPSK
jgi:hypothetical protein